MAADLVRLEKAAALWGLRPRTLYLQVLAGRARVMPCMVQPYRWRLRDIERDIDTASYPESRRQQDRDRKTQARDLRMVKGA